MPTKVKVAAIQAELSFPPPELDFLNPAYRADKARSGAGSGLGLSIAETIAREHRGKIWAESKEGKNRFLVRLPLADRGKGERGG